MTTVTLAWRTFFLTLLAVTSLQAADAPVADATKPSSPMPTPKTETAMFGAGCFWGVEYNFRRVPGVIDANSGFAGGNVDHPSYRQVCTDKTGHAEVVHVTFDPSKVTYRQLVDFFFRMHNPTQVNRQGPDYGTQYRSVIFVYSPEQRKVAEELKAALGASKKYAEPIATQIEDAKPFWKAEEYHQRYFEKNGGPTCHVTEF
jgi:peptide-methionine (S)-S-oxide reductase